ncbi:MAG: hypothetical protein OMM_01616 [Candidatus Magnetoglobus multicellularis str. Araruama]|uniref:Uncharacterized protein n=1 Tax=Candidatus Magnetoglobus multicellularis str. Araruama TaxID=890399 RepID=A0A1V1PD14_9BACT|nr:MAG: hypothetical protein OMM_01616 [Candidatus Magnetoglobus multicellularis str. Araruama]
MKEFNYTGTCIPNMHYMVDTNQKLKSIIKLINNQKYFTINRPRQYGKTTMIFLLKQKLKEDYIIIKTSFEGIGEPFFQTDENFCKTILSLFADGIVSDDEDFKQMIIDEDKGLTSLKDISKAITIFTKKANKQVILFIDEVDKAANHSLFLNFLGMLRNKYLKKNEGEDTTFHSVILAGVHDIKNLKMKIRDNKETEYNSPWNIAIDFKVDMSFSVDEISGMLSDYESDHQTGMDIKHMAKKLREYTSGYPFLVSKLCYIMDEELKQDFSENSLEQAMTIILNENNTLFDDLIKNINRYSELYNLLERIILSGAEINYNFLAHNLGIMYGILSMSSNRKLKIHNKIFEILLYDYFIAKREIAKGSALNYKYEAQFVDDSGDLDMELVLMKFQELMKAEYRDVDEKFVEREGRLLFLAFLKPIINGEGFYFVEPETRKSNRMDIVVTFNQKKFVIELKIWRGEKYAQEGREQLCKYLEFQNLNKGYLVFLILIKQKI